jgi:hypothetical protein
MPTDRPRCTATTKAGQPCKGNPYRDTGRCIAHASEETKRSLRFGGPQPNGGRPRLEKPLEVARRLVEENVEQLLRPHFAALGCRLERNEAGELVVTPDPDLRPKVTASYQGEVFASSVEDLQAQLEAAERLLDRVYGKPKQATEITGANGGPVSFADLANLANQSDTGPGD